MGQRSFLSRHVLVQRWVFQEATVCVDWTVVDILIENTQNRSANRNDYHTSCYVGAQTVEGVLVSKIFG